MEITIRQAGPADAAFIAWVLVTAARSHLVAGFWDIAFPEPDERTAMLEKMVTSHIITLCHYSCFLIADHNGKPVAGLCGYDPGVLDNIVFACALIEAGYQNEHMKQFGKRIAPIATCMPESPCGTWIIEWVATIPEYRGRGIAGILLQAIIEKGARSGYKIFQISIEIGNLSALQVYQKAGFSIIDEKHSNEYEEATGAPGIARMQLYQTAN